MFSPEFAAQITFTFLLICITPIAIVGFFELLRIIEKFF